MRRNPIAPESTTPAFLRAGRSSGVRSRDASPASIRAVKTSTASSVSSAFLTAASEASRETVSTVPSVGFMTDLYAAFTPSSSAAANSAPVAVVLSFRPFEMPLNRSDNITPEFPLAPRSIAEAAAPDTALTVTLSSIAVSSAREFLMVMDIFVPVSPSGTGNTLSSSTLFLLFMMLCAPDMIPSRSSLPLISK